VSTVERLVLSAARIVDARDALDAATSERDEVIRLARAEGLSLRSIALIAGVSHQTIANVVAAGASTTTETQRRPPV
jgi:DNA-directed RNA polymerase specialized sigma24 family protein